MVGGCVVSSGKPSCDETMTPGARASKPRALVVRRHHLLVRISHWLNLPLLLGLILSGISIYWASPIYQHLPNPTTGSFDYLADAGIWICAHIPWLHHYADPANWVYNHGSLGPYMLAFALRFHWLCAYLFMLNGLVYLAGLCIGGGWRSLLPRLSDARGVLQMASYYLSLAYAILAWPYVILARRQQIHPSFRTTYNPLQRLAYFAVAVAGFLAVATGWAIHKPAQLSWLTAFFGGFDKARVWHFWLMVFFMLFVIPHVVLVVADGWDTLRSMITGWSTRFKRSEVSDHEL
jgi:thiosulfate reductase cytochrome b subunit